MIVSATALFLLVSHWSVRADSNSDLTTCKSNLKNIGTALEMYSTDYEGLYPPSMSHLTPNYLKTIPTCPSTGKDTYSSTLKVAHYDPPTEIGGVDEITDSYYFHCSGGKHPGISGDYPSYDFIQGLVDRP